MSNSKLGSHFQGMDNQVAALVNSEYVKVMAPPVQNPFPQCKVIARWHMTESQQDAMILQGAAGGRELYEFLKLQMEARPWVYAVEAWNEPLAMGLFDPVKRKLLVEATAEFLLLAHLAGWRVVVGNFSVGQPPEEAWKQFAQIIRAMGPEDMLGLHEYGWPRMDAEMDAANPGEGWWCLRYRKVARWLAEQGVAMPRTIINECGIDKLLAGSVPGGWMTTNTNEDLARQSYFDQLVWYDRELAKDDYIVAATPFTAAAGNPWETYNIDLPLATMIHNHIATANFPAETGRARGFDASKYQANVNWDLVRREGFSFCILRASGPNQWPDYTGLEVDPALDSHWRGAGSIGLLRGAYHFLLPDVDGQAAHFDTALGLRPFELPPFADVEVGGTTEGKVRAFLEAADAWRGRRTGVYTNLSLYKSLNMAPWMGDRSLWLAQWGVAAPSVTGWEFWQYDVAAAGAVQGFPGRLDLNWYNGTAAQLRARYGEAAPDPPVVVEPETPAEEGTMTEIDPRIAGLVSVTGAEPGALYRLARVGWKNEVESQGRHHIYIDVVDGEGQRLAGERVTMTWGGGSSVGVVEEKPGEPFGANFPMNASLGSYSAFAGTDPTASDRISGLGLGTPEHPNTLIHTCFELVFVKGTATVSPVVPPVVPPDPEPEPEPPEDVVPEEEEEEVSIVDERIKDFVTVTQKDGDYHVTHVDWKNEQEAKGLHHVFIDVIDQNGRRMPGEKVTLAWPGGSSVATVEAKPGEPFGANFPLNAILGSYTVYAGTDPGRSDEVHGLGLGTPEHPDVFIHTAFEIVFVKGRVMHPEPEPEPTPEPEPEPEPDMAEIIEKLEQARALLDEALTLLQDR